MKKLICFILIGISAFSCFGIETEQDTPEQKRRSILCLPIFYYTPETKIAGGALVNYISHKSGSESISRPSTFMPSVVYTQKKQIILPVFTHISLASIPSHAASNCCLSSGDVARLYLSLIITTDDIFIPARKIVTPASVQKRDILAMSS